MSTLLRLPLSARQAEALAKALSHGHTGFLNSDEQAALREVAEKLDTLRGER